MSEQETYCLKGVEITEHTFFDDKKCPSCGCKMEFKTQKDENRNGDFYEEKYYECPNCDTEIDSTTGEVTTYGN